MTPVEKIGFIGLGKMGLPMARNIAKAGYRLTLWNRTAAKCREVDGAQAAASIADLAAEQDVTISMISDDPALLRVSNEVLAAARQKSIYIDMSTVSPATSLRVAEACAERGVAYLRAPVSGSVSLAQAGTLTIMCSGLRDAYDQVEPLLGAMGAKLFYVGPEEQARYIKLTINMMVGLTAAMAAEALSFSQKGGMDWDTTLEIMANSVVASPLIGYKLDLLKKREFQPDFTAQQMAKDFDLMLGSGRDLAMPLPLTSMVRQYLEAMRARDMGEQDFFGLVKVWESLGAVR